MTSTLTILEELEAAIRTVAREDTSSRNVDLAMRFYEENPSMIATFGRDWIVEKLTTLIRQHRSKIQIESNPQQLLFGFKPPRQIEYEKGKTIDFGDATLRKLRLYRRRLFKEKRSYLHPSIVRIDKTIEFMKPHAAAKKGISVNEAVTLGIRPTQESESPKEKGHDEV
jgi:hypothetical protein